MEKIQINTILSNTRFCDSCPPDVLVKRPVWEDSDNHRRYVTPPHVRSSSLTEAEVLQTSVKHVKYQ